MDFVWNVSAAEQVRSDCERAVNRQIAHMERTVESYRRIAEELQVSAVAQEQIRDTAMKPQSTWNPSANRYEMRSVPDHDARREAGARARDLNNQVTDLTGAAGNLDTAIGTLRLALRTANNKFIRMERDTLDADLSASSRIRSVEENMARFTAHMRAISESFNSHTLLSLVFSRSELRNVDDDDVIFALLAAGMAGLPLFSVFAGDPVNMSTGNFIYTKEDMNISGRFPLSFKRFYNTIGNGTAGAMGYSWSHSYEIKLNAEEKTVNVSFGDGHVETYCEIEEGIFIPVIPTGKALIKTETAWLLHSTDMDTYTFNVDGLLENITDVVGNKIELSYADNILKQVSTPSGFFSFAYNSEKQLIKVTDPLEQELKLEYAGNRLSKVIYPAGAEHSYSYDPAGRLRELYTDPDVRETLTEFDSKNRAVKQHLADSSVLEYHYDDTNNKTTLVQQNGNRIIYKRDEKYRTTEIEYTDGAEQFEFDVNNQKTSKLDKRGFTTKYAYNEAGKICEIISPLGVKTEIEYSEKKQLASVLVDGVRKFQNSYDDKGNLATIEDASENKTGFSYIENGIPEAITQSDGSQIKFEYDNRKNITKIIDGTGIETVYRYDALNRVVATIDGNGNETSFNYDPAGNITAVKNAAGDFRNYTYNMAGKVIEVEDFDKGLIKQEYNAVNKAVKSIDKLGRETVFDYDKVWNLSYIKQPNGAETKLLYNSLSKLCSVEKANGGTISYEYDANGNRAKVTDELGNVTKLKYNSQSLPIEITAEDGLSYSYTYNADGQMTSAKDALGNTVSLKYNASGQLIEETNALGESRQYTYTAMGKIAGITDESGCKTIYEYGSGGRLCAVIYHDGTKAAYSYDKAGNIVRVQNRTGQIQNYTYDCLNRITEITDTTGAKKRYFYDAMSNVIKMTDETGNITHYEYTLTGKLSKVIDPLGNEATYTYDECNRLIETCQNGVNVTKYERDIMGQVKTITDALGHKETYGYDLKGQLIEKLDKDGHLTKYAYTAHGDVAHIKYSDSREVKLSYNALRQLTEVIDWLGITRIETDKLGRARKVINHQGKEIGYTWGAGGLKTGITYPDGKNVSYFYDGLQRLAKVEDGANTASYHYDEQSRLIEKVFSNGVSTNYSYNGLGQLSELSHAGVDGLLDRYVYSYDIMGNKSEVLRERQGLSDESGVYSYTYDELNRLLDVSKYNTVLRAYEYDAYGNRTKKTDGGTQTSYSYNAMNQLISTVDSLGDEQVYSYDKRGNLTNVHRNGSLAKQYDFGALNRLEQVVNYETKQSASYSYNGMGYRVGQTVGDLNPTKQIDDVLDMTRQFNNLLQRSEDGIATDYIWDATLLSATTQGEKHRDYLLDELGSPARLLLDGETTESFAYDEFGNTHIEPSSAQPFGFTGYMHDTIAGTWFAQAREYDAHTGRFTAKDTHWHPGNMIWGDAETYSKLDSPMRGLTPDPMAIGQSGNLYTYTLNNPVNSVDLIGGYATTASSDGVTEPDEPGFWAGLRDGFGSGVVHGLSSLSPGLQTVIMYQNLTYLGQALYNDDPALVFDRTVSNYRGQNTIRIPLPMGAGASFGPVMILESSLRYPTALGVLRHENAHHLEYQMLGFARYLFGIAIPSFRNAARARNLPMSYHAQPWEIHADLLAGLIGQQFNPDGTLQHNAEALLLGLAYFAHLQSIHGTDWFRFLTVDLAAFTNHNFSALKDGR